MGLNAMELTYILFLSHTQTHTYFQLQIDSQVSGVFVQKLQPKVGSRGYDILFAYFVVEVKSKIKCRIFIKTSKSRIRSKIGLVAEKLFKFLYNLFFWWHSPWSHPLKVTVQDKVLGLNVPYLQTP